MKHDNDNVQKPKKILKISDLTFILPDNFSGNLQNALMLLAAYLNVVWHTDYTSKNKNRCFSDSGEIRVDMRYGIFEIDENGDYQIK